MTTVRIPVRVRLDLDAKLQDQPNDEFVDLVRDATASAADRAADRVLRVPLVRDAAWQAGPPAMPVRFTGDRVPPLLATRLAAGVRAGLASTAMRLPAPSGGRARPSVTTAPPVTPRLRTFPDLAAVWDAVLDHYDGTPPADVLVVARIEGDVPHHWIMTATGVGEPPLVVDVGRFVTFPVSVEGGVGAPRPSGGMPADRLRFRRRFATDEQWRATLSAMWREDIDRRAARLTPAQKQEQVRIADQRVRNSPSRGSGVLYEFLRADTHVAWYLGPAGITTGTVPVAVLTEQAPRGAAGAGKRGSTVSASLDLRSADEADLNEPYLQEPSLDQWPGNAAYLARLVREIATRLRMPEGRYPGSFAIVAMAVIIDQSLPAGSLDRGTLARQAELRRLAETTVLVNNLAFAYVEEMHSLDRAHALPPPLSGHAAQWAHHFFLLYGQKRREAVAQLFVSTCQDILLEVLERSAAELARRLDENEFPRYMATTRVLLLILLSQSVELEDLRRGIAEARAREARLTAGAWRAPHAHQRHIAWRNATADVVAAIRDGAPDARPAGAVTYVDGQYWAKDAEGHWWSEKQLALAIGTARDEAFRADPLLEKVTDLREVVHRLRDARRRDDERGQQEGRAVDEQVDATFHALLEEIQQENRKRTGRVRHDRRIAFGLASFTEERSDEIGARLTGMYRLADKRLRPMFDHKEIYLDGLRELADAELGKAELVEFFNLVGLPFLAVFCPPAAFLIGAGMAVDSLMTAYEHRGVQRAMLGGDEIISAIQVEAELWAAWIGAALTFLPEVPRGTRAVARAASRVLPGAERRAAAIAATRLAEQEAKRALAAATEEALVAAFLREVATGYVLNLAISAAVDRFIEAVVAEEPSAAGSAGELRQTMGEAVATRGAS